MARHGGGAFSGKDPSKVDRSAAYAMRWVAKNVVAAGLASRCEVQVAYAIGKAEPVGLFVETFGTATVDPEKIESAISEVFDLRPAAIIRDLDLLRPIYAKTAAYGHFGRALPEFTWEQPTRVEALRKAAGSDPRGVTWLRPGFPSGVPGLSRVRGHSGCGPTPFTAGVGPSPFGEGAGTSGAAASSSVRRMLPYRRRISSAARGPSSPPRSPACRPSARSRSRPG